MGTNNRRIMKRENYRKTVKEKRDMV
jgi:hypothetical protein